jgi:hypothetical protein
VNRQTPGPWRRVGYHIASESNLVVASCYADTPQSVVMRPKDDLECVANARLIAAAPELLGTLKNLVSVFPEIGEDSDLNGADAIDRLNELWPAITSAIGKAEKELR